MHFLKHLYIVMKRIAIFLTLSIILPVLLHAQSSQKDKMKDMDPEVYAYYKECEKYKRLPQVLTMSDTLYSMAEAKGDTRTMCASLCYKPQYYLNLNITDSADKYVDYCKMMARKLGEPRYYYYIWNKQIRTQLEHHSYVTAMQQLRVMEDEATREQSQKGIIECYRSLSEAYSAQMNHELALEYNTKLLDYIDRNNIEEYNYISYIFGRVEILLNLKRYDEIPALLAKGRKIAVRESQKISLLCAEISYYTAIHQYETVEGKIAEYNSMVEPNQVSDYGSGSIAQYYYQTHQYSKAVEVLEHYYANGGTPDNMKNIYIKCLFQIPQRQEEAIRLGGEYFATLDSIRSYEQITALAEFSALMDNQQLKEENMRIRTQRSNLIAFLAVLFSILAWFAHRLMGKRHKLKDVTLSNQAMEADLKAAGQIQAHMLPNTFPPFPDHKEFSLYALMRPAKLVGGDLYDYYMLDSKLYFVVGDVSGKGVPASLIMSSVCSVFRNFAQKDTPIEEITRSLNYAVVINNDSNFFVTLMAGVLDTSNGSLTLCNAGHNTPFLMRDHEVSLVDMGSGLPLGLLDHDDYPTLSLTMNPGDKLMLFTDGLTEAENHDQQQFGLQRVQQLLSQHSQLDPTALIQKITQEVDRYVGDSIQSDDLTILTIQYNHPTEQ